MSKAQYYQPAFWQQRYKANVCEWYQWLATPNQLNPIISKILPSNSNILELGCGSSNFAQKLATQGHKITCVDFSKEIIKNRAKSNTNSSIVYKHQNILQKLNFQDQQFDIIIQKNTLDCLFCQDYFIDKVLRCMKQCFRVLKVEGKMISITHGKQKNRKYFYRTKLSPFQLQLIPFSHPKTQQKLNIFVLTKDSSDQNQSNHQIIRQDQNQNQSQRNQSQNNIQNNDENDQNNENKDQEQNMNQEQKADGENVDEEGEKNEDQAQNNAGGNEDEAKEQGEEQYQFQNEQENNQGQ